MVIRQTQRKLYALFQEFARNGKHLTIPVILDRTGYKITSVRPYIAKGFWQRYLQEAGPETYTVHNMDGVSLEDFCASISQKRTGVVLHEQRTLDQELLHQSALEFQLAVELFNRPTTPNRIDAFVVHFCAAWEKLLKARLIREKGAEAIWVKGEQKPKSISLRTALRKLYADNDPVLQNIMEINALRDESMHYMLNELGPMASRYFQAGVLNFFDAYKTLVGEPPVALSGVGMLSIVFDAEEPDQAILDQKYGKAKATAIVKKIRELGRKADESDDRTFAIPLRYAIGFVNKHENPDLTIERIPEGQRVFIEKPTVAVKTHPYFHKQIVAMVNEQLGKRFNPDALSRILPDRKVKAFNGHDLTCIIAHEKWKEQNNDYHFDHGVRNVHTYSAGCVDYIVQKLLVNERYLHMVKEKWKRRRDGKRR